MKKQFAFVAIALSTLAAGTAAHAAEQTYVPPSYSTLTRAQVQADLADDWRGETPGFYSVEYRHKFAVYQQRLAQQQTNPSVAAR